MLIEDRRRDAELAGERLARIRRLTKGGPLHSYGDLWFQEVWLNWRDTYQTRIASEMASVANSRAETETQRDARSWLPDSVKWDKRGRLLRCLAGPWNEPEEKRERLVRELLADLDLRSLADCVLLKGVLREPLAARVWARLCLRDALLLRACEGLMPSMEFVILESTSEGDRETDEFVARAWSSRSRATRTKHLDAWRTKPGFGRLLRAIWKHLGSTWMHGYLSGLQRHETWDGLLRDVFTEFDAHARSRAPESADPAELAMLMGYGAVRATDDLGTAIESADRVRDLLLPLLTEKRPDRWFEDLPREDPAALRALSAVLGHEDRLRSIGLHLDPDRKEELHERIRRAHPDPQVRVEAGAVEARPSPGRSPPKRDDSHLLPGDDDTWTGGYPTPKRPRPRG